MIFVNILILISLFTNLFNRWSNEVFNMKNYNDCWDRKSNTGFNPMNNNGVPPNGTYYILFIKVMVERHIQDTCKLDIKI